MYCYFKDNDNTKSYVIGQSWARNAESSNKWTNDNCINVYVGYKVLVGKSNYSDSNKLTDSKYDSYIKQWNSKNSQEKSKTLKKIERIFTRNFNEAELTKLNIKWNCLKVEKGMYI